MSTKHRQYISKVFVAFKARGSIVLTQTTMNPLLPRTPPTRNRNEPIKTRPIYASNKLPMPTYMPSNIPPTPSSKTQYTSIPNANSTTIPTINIKPTNVTIPTASFLIIPSTNPINIPTVNPTSYVIHTTDVNIPSEVSFIPDYAFVWCSFNSVIIPTTVTGMGIFAFARCTSLTYISIATSVTTIGESAFHYCLSLASITIPTSVTFIGVAVFNFCPSLAFVSIPTSLTAISSGLFSHCPSLSSSFSIPTSINTIGNNSFYSCTLTTIFIPTSVNYIGYHAFGHCTSLTCRVIAGSPTVESTAFDSPNTC